jgi:hypothetical protein
VFFGLIGLGAVVLNFFLKETLSKPIEDEIEELQIPNNWSGDFTDSN